MVQHLIHDSDFINCNSNDTLMYSFKNLTPKSIDDSKFHTYNRFSLFSEDLKDDDGDDL